MDHTGKTIVSMGGWEIRYKDVYERNLKYYASHLACIPGDMTSFDELAWFYTDADALCHHCGVDVPDEVQAVVAMLV